MLKKHIKKEHKPDMKHTCEMCDYGTHFVASMWEHSFSQHHDKSPQFKEIQTENLIMKIVAEQNANLIDEIETLKEDTKRAFNGLAIAIDESIENMREEAKDNCKSLVDTITNLSNKISVLGAPRTRKSETSRPASSTTAKTASPSNPKVKQKPKPQTPISSSNTSRPTSYQAKPSVKSKPTSSFNSKPKVSWFSWTHCIHPALGILWKL